MSSQPRDTVPAIAPPPEQTRALGRGLRAAFALPKAPAACGHAMVEALNKIAALEARGKFAARFSK